MFAPHHPHHWTAVQRVFAIVVPATIATWMIAVPTRMGPSSFLAAVVLLTALGWVTFTTYWSTMPASSLARSRHDSDHGPDGHRRHRSRS